MTTHHALGAQRRYAAVAVAAQRRRRRLAAAKAAAAAADRAAQRRRPQRFAQRAGQGAHDAAEAVGNVGGLPEAVAEDGDTFQKGVRVPAEKRQSIAEVQ